jgi:hypothetical protein
MDPSTSACPVSVLETEKARLENAVTKLRESNAALRAAAADEADEGEARALRAAVNENLPIIAKYTARAAALGEEIERAKAGAGPSEPERMAEEDGGEGGREGGGGGEGGGDGGRGKAAAAGAAQARQSSPPPPPPPDQAGSDAGVWL